MKITSYHKSKKALRGDPHVSFMHRLEISDSFRFTLKNTLIQKFILEDLVDLPKFLKEEYIEIECHSDEDSLVFIKYKGLKDVHTFKGCEINI